MVNKSPSNLDKFFDDEKRDLLRKYAFSIDKLKPLDKYELEPQPTRRRKSKSNFSGTIEDLDKKIDFVNERFDQLKAEMQKVTDDAQKNLKTETDKMSQKVEESKGRVIETLGLFVALFTFLSLQVQIMKDETNIIHITGMLLLSGGMISLFVMLLDLIIHAKDGSEHKPGLRFTVLFGICILLIGGGIVILIMPR